MFCRLEREVGFMPFSVSSKISVSSIFSSETSVTSSQSRYQLHGPSREISGLSYTVSDEMSFIGEKVQSLRDIFSFDIVRKRALTRIGYKTDENMQP